MNHGLMALLPLAAWVLLFGSFGALLRWQPWHSRLLLPLLILSIPLAALACSEMKTRTVFIGVATVLAAAAVPCLLWNASRPLVTPPYLVQAYLNLPDNMTSVLAEPRDAQYFNNAVRFRQCYVEAAHLIRTGKARNVGLRLHTSLEYPIWALTRDASFHGPRIENLDVENVSSRIEIRRFQPDMIFVGDHDDETASLERSLSQ
jgi:hypothetical protein